MYFWVFLLKVLNGCPATYLTAQEIIQFFQGQIYYGKHAFKRYSDLEQTVELFEMQGKYFLVGVHCCGLSRVGFVLTLRSKFLLKQQFIYLCMFHYDEHLHGLCLCLQSEDWEDW